MFQYFLYQNIVSDVTDYSNPFRLMIGLQARVILDPLSGPQHWLPCPMHLTHPQTQKLHLLLVQVKVHKEQLQLLHYPLCWPLSSPDHLIISELSRRAQQLKRLVQAVLCFSIFIFIENKKWQACSDLEIFHLLAYRFFCFWNGRIMTVGFFDLFFSQMCHQTC